MAAALASGLSSMPPSETSPTPGIEVANAKVKAWSEPIILKTGINQLIGQVMYEKEIFRGYTMKCCLSETRGVCKITGNLG